MDTISSTKSSKRLSFTLFFLPILLLIFHTVLVDALSVGASRGGAPSAAVKETRWVVVGGGPHGVHIAARLLEEGGVSRGDLAIVDDEDQLLVKWKRRTMATGMAYLRSSSSYHLDVEEDALRNYAKKSKMVDGRSLFAPDYKRPLLELFNQHCDHVVDKFDLGDVHVQGTVTQVEPFEDYVRIFITESSGDVLECRAENVVLALGNDSPAYPTWVCHSAIKSGKIRHIFDEEPPAPSTHENSDRHSSIAVVGGGISGAHLALKLSREMGPCATVHMICRHDLREQQFDTHQDWMMDSDAAKRSQAGGGQGIPECQRHFSSLNSFAERRVVISQERKAGTISASVSRGKGGLRYAIRDERIHWHKAEVSGMTEDDDGVVLSLSSGEEVRVSRVLLATGFGKRPPGGDLINAIADSAGLKLCSCGYPAPDRNLRWHKHIFVAGALAELELGPSARNIAGGRLASERIVAAAKDGEAPRL
uniref:L-ornithine N(5)-monooxygenase [NAD(P)H] n=1 Tax=Odontella aurita TaxID=265563 RepID=A0A7S4K8P4_9STRA|mmetsp:Transcript_6894/g.20660  ORF Transcript_6894/g.20660 Transcript_6894/m.20660 type:complete len:478 (+) Transcript_6894:273-1706(+)